MIESTTVFTPILSLSVFISVYLWLKHFSAIWGLKMMRIIFLLTAGLCVTGPLATAGDEAKRLDHSEFFESRIRPILVEHCFRCHGPKKQESGLRLDSREGLLKGNDAGPVVVPGRPDESPLIEAIGHDGPVKMPPKAKLPAQAIADLTAWVKLGLPWPASGVGGAGGASVMSADTRNHWSLQPVKDRIRPVVKDAAWPRTSVDHFILARLEAKGLSPSPRADKRTLIRRATFDLIGLPPTPEEIEAFEADTTASAYDQLIERLLASPRYGERWGRHWLDVRDMPTPRATFYSRMPIFTGLTPTATTSSAPSITTCPMTGSSIEQIAADRLPAGQARAPLAALGFLTLGARFMGNFHDVIDDRIDVVCRGLMSLTVTCARCHDHKFDPIPRAIITPCTACWPAPASRRFHPRPTGHRTRRPIRSSSKSSKRGSGSSASLWRTSIGSWSQSSKRRVAEYLLAAQQALDQPTTEDFMLLADGNDLNPAMLVRWQAYLSRTRKGHDPVFAPGTSWQPCRRRSSRLASSP